MSYLLDTDVVSNQIKKIPSAKLLQKLASIPISDQSTSSITLGELIYGAWKSYRTEEILAKITEAVPRELQIRPFDSLAAEVYGRVRAHLVSSGNPVAEPDLRIASIALAYDLILVTGNERHFARVPGLRIENWLE